MIDLSCKYMGLDLKSPIIVGSCGLTHSVSKIKQIEEYGAGAVVLKSIFEEQITNEIKQNVANVDFDVTYIDALDYIKGYTELTSFEKYINLINESKKAVSIPVIASINCSSDGDWASYSKKIEDAGADALELNIFFLPADFNRSGVENEARYFKIIEHVKKVTRLPVAVKIGSYFSGLANFIQKLSYTGVNSIVMFNRFFSPDINIEKIIVEPAPSLIEKEGFYNSLRWMAIMYNHVNCSLSASSGIATSTEVIKQLLAGADTVQVVTALYNNGLSYLKDMHDDLRLWMEKHHFNKVNDFKGKLGFENSDNSDIYLRIQFMKHFAGIE